MYVEGPWSWLEFTKRCKKIYIQTYNEDEIYIELSYSPYKLVDFNLLKD